MSGSARRRSRELRVAFEAFTRALGLPRLRYRPMPEGYSRSALVLTRKRAEFEAARQAMLEFHEQIFAHLVANHDLPPVDARNHSFELVRPWIDPLIRAAQCSTDMPLALLCGKIGSRAGG